MRPFVKTFSLFNFLVIYLTFLTAPVWANNSLPYNVIGYLEVANNGNSRNQVLAQTAIPWNDLSALYLSFASISGTSVSYTPRNWGGADYTNLVSIAHTNNTRIYIVLGGAGSDSTFGSATNSPANMTAFVSSIMNVVDTNGFDGVDIDWEFPTLAEKSQFMTLMQDLSADLRAETAYDGKPKGIDFFASAGSEICGVNWATIGNYVDYAILSGYDYSASVGGVLYNGPVSVPAGTNYTDCNGATRLLCSSDNAAKLNADGLAYNQMVLGCPLYLESAQTDIYTVMNTGTYQSTSVLEMESLYSGYSTYGANDTNAFCDKINWGVAQKGMAGVALWEISMACPSSNAQMTSLWNAITNSSGCVHLPTATCTMTATPTNTATVASTSTATNSPTASQTATFTPTFSPTSSPTCTSTLGLPLSTSTSTSSPTETFTPGLATNTCTASPTSSMTETYTSTPLNAATATMTATVTASKTATSIVVHPTPVIFPNPATGSTTQIDLFNTSPVNVVVKVYTLAFREVQTYSAGVVLPGNNCTVPLADKTGSRLANGLYYFVVTADGNRTVFKVLVLQ